MIQTTDKNENEQDGLSIFDKVLDAFFLTLEKTPEFLEISTRLKKEKNYSEINIRRALFGDEE
jgi:hypothetical protein